MLGDRGKGFHVKQFCSFLLDFGSIGCGCHAMRQVIDASESGDSQERFGKDFFRFGTLAPKCQCHCPQLRLVKQRLCVAGLPFHHEPKALIEHFAEVVWCG